MLGLLGLIVFHAKKLSDHVKENIGFSVILQDEIRDVDANFLRKTLDASPFVKQTEYISKERAANEMKKQIGEDFISSLGYNPLSASIDVRLRADYANNDSIAKIENKLLAYRQVKEVHYHKSLVNLVNENISKISVIILMFSALMLFIALVLINNTVRLSVYSKRFIINTMKLVGATWGFIRQPFLLKSMLHGLYAAILAIAMLSGVVYLIVNEIEEFLSLGDLQLIAMLFGLVVVLGIVLNLMATFLAVNKFLRLKTDDLYY